MIPSKPTIPADGSLRPRIITILLGAPIFFAALWMGGRLWLATVLLVAAALGWELERLTTERTGAGSSAGSSGLPNARGGWEGAILAVLASYVAGRFGLTGAGAVAVGITVYSGIRELFFFHQRPLRRVLALTWSTLYVGLLWGSLILLREVGGFYWCLWAVGITWSSDIGAFLVGRRLGRHKIAPQLSPGKSWEGFVAGLVSGGAVALVLGMPLGLPPPVRLGLGLLTAFAAALGDFWESALKREAGVKDTSLILPGHGGFLDRMDSLLVAGAFTLLIARAYGAL
ncbi:MAG: phosphatidate cytidylyltransferase [Limnochordales bacterium]|nr:phosphatidate cytidylyltransferase [Limnochordales bacterium]